MDQTPQTPETVRDLVVLNRYGIHARPAALLVKTAATFADEELYLAKGDITVNAKSIMGLLTLEGHHGARLRVIARGPRAEEAADAIAELFRVKFYED